MGRALLLAWEAVEVVVEVVQGEFETAFHSTLMINGVHGIYACIVELTDYSYRLVACWY